ncbi:MAG: SPOR domain-containing protein [Gammaproteobacteria bacterium]|nr:SPOR domain-containing protein [Gammaproteobacteria bacterium]
MMKKVSLFLLAVNLIIGLWLYTNLNRSTVFAGKKAQQDVTQAEVILTLDEMGVEASGKATAPLSEDPIEVALAPNVELQSPLFVSEDDELEGENSEPSASDSDQSLRQNVEAKVKQVVGFVGDVIDDIELPVTLKSHCYTLGPFAESAQAELAAQRLQAQVIQVTTSLTERHEAGGYWVYIPSDGLRSARKQIAELKRRGINDVALSSESGVRHWVSLGVYTTKERASRRQVALSNIGFYTRTEPRVIKVPEHWIDITLRPEQELTLIDGVRQDSWPVLKKTFCREAGVL